MTLSSQTRLPKATRTYGNTVQLSPCCGLVFGHDYTNTNHYVTFVYQKWGQGAAKGHRSRS